MFLNKKVAAFTQGQVEHLNQTFALLTPVANASTAGVLPPSSDKAKTVHDAMITQKASGEEAEPRKAGPGQQALEPPLIQRLLKISVLLRQLQHIAYTEHQRTSRIRLKYDDSIIDTNNSIDTSLDSHTLASQYFADTEKEPMVLQMIAEPMLLTWDELLAMPAMRKQTGRGGKAACVKQRQLRTFCCANNIDKVDLAEDACNWRLLLKTMPCLNTPAVI